MTRPLNALKKPLTELPPGFDADHYRALNPDVAAACPGDGEAAAHYETHGVAEMRRIMPDGVGISDPQSRALATPKERRDWLDWLRRESRSRDLVEVIREHPRAAWLATAFNLASYLVARPDVAAKLDTPLQGAFHFLEFGVEEGAYGYPRDVDPRHLRLRYGDLFADLAPDETPGVEAILRKLRAAGRDPFDITLNEAEFWELFGIDGQFMGRQFDHEYYHALATRHGMAPPGMGRLDCISHFCTKGAGAGLTGNPDHEIDTPFCIEHWVEVTQAERDGARSAHLTRAEYRASCLEKLADELDVTPETLIAATGAEGAEEPDSPIAPRLYRHWLHTGLRQCVAPNIRFWARRRFGLFVPWSMTARLREIARQGAAEDGGFIDRLSRCFETPLPYLHELDALSSAETKILTELGDGLAVKGEHDQAEWLYRRVLVHHPEQQRALNHLADLMTRTGRAGAAHELRMRWHEMPGAKSGARVWNLLELAALSLDHSALRAVAAHLEQARPLLGGDEAQTARYRALAERLFTTLWEGIGAHAQNRGIAAAQEFLCRALRLNTPDMAPIPDRPAPVTHVALLANTDLYQCRLYRVDQKAEQLRAAGCEVTVFDQRDGLETFHAGLERFSAAIFYRVPAFPDIMKAIAACTVHGVPSFYEIDDLIFDTAHFPPPFESYAAQITRAHHRDMACSVPLFDHAMRLCDYGIGSTRVLCEAMAERVRSGRAFEHHNALGALHLAAIEDQETLPARPSEAPLVLFYGSGTLAHKEDFHSILEPALAEILRRYKGRVELHLVGSYGAFRHLDPTSEAIRVLPPVWDFEQYCSMLAGADINLSVLAPGPVTDAKSEIKWMEAAMFGIPSVVSHTASHADVIAHGETGFLCKTSRDFSQAISGLIDDPALRRSVGARARDLVLQDYGLEAMGRNLTGILDSIARPARTRPLLAIVAVFYPPQAIGGGTRVVHDNVTDILAEHGEDFDIVVICSREGATPYSLSAYVHEGVPVWAIGTPEQNGTEMTARDSRMGEVFAKLLDRLAPDLVHFHGVQRLTSTVVDVTRRRDIPYLITLHDGWWMSDRQFLLDPETDTLDLYDYTRLNDPAAPPRARVLWPALSGAEYVLPVSEPFARLCRDCGLPNLRTVENGVSRLPDVTRRPHPEGRVRLAHIGGSERHKGLHLVRNALVSRGFDNLEMLVIDLALPPGHVEHELWGTTPVIREGKVPQAQVEALYARIDVLLAPSVWPETYGLVTREALASGAWVVASDRGAVAADVTEGENGHIVDVGDYSDLARVLGLIDADPARYTAPPPTRPEIRKAADQARELAGIYAEILHGRVS